MEEYNETKATQAAAEPKPLWGGRFSAAPTGELERFGASLPFDKRMWKQDIRGSKAHAAMLAHQGVISTEDAKAIRAGLDEIAGEIERGEFTFDVDRDEDIHMAIERVLTERIGPAGGRLHTGRSRNDQTAVDTHMIARDLADELLASLEGIQQVLLDRAEEQFGIVMPGYTHMQPAQPVLLSHHLLAYFWMFSRDHKRVADARAAANKCPLGAAALAVGSSCLQLVHTRVGIARVKGIRGEHGEKIRVLQQGGVYQSATYVGERRFEPVFAYYRAFDAMFEAEPVLCAASGHGVERVLMLGGGGYAYPKHALTQHAGLVMDVVEIDPAVTLVFPRRARAAGRRAPAEHYGGCSRLPHARRGRGTSLRRYRQRLLFGLRARAQSGDGRGAVPSEGLLETRWAVPRQRGVGWRR